MRKFNILVFCLILCSSSFANAQNQSTKKWKKFSNKEVSIGYPSDWTIDESGKQGTTFILFSPNEQENFATNINLLIQDLSAYPYDLDKYMQITEKNVSSILTNGKIIETTRIKDKKGEHHRLIYSGDFKGKILQWLQYIWVPKTKAFKEKAYVLTLTCEPTAFDQYLEVGESILKTFKIN